MTSEAIAIPPQLGLTTNEVHIPAARPAINPAEPDRGEAQPASNSLPPLGPTTERLQVTAVQAATQPLADPDGRAALPASDYPPPPSRKERHLFTWNENNSAAKNYNRLGVRLAASGDLFRRPGHGDGMLLASSFAVVPPKLILTGAQLGAIIADRIRVRVYKNGKHSGSCIPQTHLNTMLAAEVFLQCFRPIDTVVQSPMYLPNFTLTRPGFNDAGFKNRVFYAGKPPAISASMDAIKRFLEIMAFATNADQTNAYAAALTVLLRNHWLGGKPVLAVTASKSHAGKDTIVSFASGGSRISSISYQSTNWPVERAFVGALKFNTDTAIVNIENARAEHNVQFIASSFVERFITDPEPLLFSTGTGPATRRSNDVVVAVTTNFGTLSTDLLNRALPIHLNPTGNIEDRISPIGNPKLEYLPEHQAEIAAELRGMVERWKQAGQPLDMNAKHPFTPWARTIGGILMVNHLTDFLANYGQRKSADDPLRKGLGILGAASPGNWMSVGAWARRAVTLGLDKTIIPAADRGTEASQKRGMGVVLSAHVDETFRAETDAQRFLLKLEKSRRRFEGGQPSTRYRFVVLEQSNIPADDDPATVAASPAAPGANPPQVAASTTTGQQS